MISMAGGGSDGGGGSGDGTEELASDEDVQTHLALHPGCQERPSETQKNYHLKKKKKKNQSQQVPFVPAGCIKQTLFGGRCCCQSV